MLFSSEVFLFVFLPAVLLGYYILKPLGRQLQNIFLLLASLVFYAWGEPQFVIIMITSIVANYIFGLLIGCFKEKKKLKCFFLILSIIYNVSILFVFKYLVFTLTNVNSIFSLHLPVPNIVLPIGISFFTFQSMSYVFDVYKGTEESQKNIIDLSLYIALFPQLIAGPIVRYNTVAYQIKNRKESVKQFSEGVPRFILGLFKKVMLANTLALVSDKAFSIPAGELSCAFSWLGAICYTLMIFYDFSGYSDMAIGLGKMFGFEFEENFNYPYISKSVSEFWRRWHMSLGTWFRDYIYFPMGGSRVKTKSRLVLNLFTVWFLTGVWHGANWTFVLWGIFYFVFLTLEKLYQDKFQKIPVFIRYIYTMLCVIFGWVLFRADNVSLALSYMKAMIIPTNIDASLAILHLKEHGLALFIGILMATPHLQKFIEKHKGFPILRIFACVVMFVSSSIYIIKGGYNVFIYFNF